MRQEQEHWIIESHEDFTGRQILGIERWGKAWKIYLTQHSPTPQFWTVYADERHLTRIGEDERWECIVCGAQSRMAGFHRAKCPLGEPAQPTPEWWWYDIRNIVAAIVGHGETVSIVDIFEVHGSDTQVALRTVKGYVVEEMTDLTARFKMLVEIGLVDPKPK